MIHVGLFPCDVEVTSVGLIPVVVPTPRFDPSASQITRSANIRLCS